MDDNALNIGDTSLVTFTFSETPVGFTTDDVTVANGSIGAIDATDPLVQTAVYTPTNGITDATNIITVGTAWTDAALNTGVGGDSPNYTIDTVAPTSGSVSGGRRFVVPPLIHVTKIPNPLALSAPGGMVTYTNKVTNPGTVPLSNVRLIDDKCGPVNYVSGDINGNSRLDPVETWIYICATNLNQTTVNTITASGDANGLTATNFAIVTVVVADTVVPSLPKSGFPPQNKYEFIKNLIKILGIYY